MFVDASAIVAILTLEADHERFAARIGDADDPMTSPLAIFEATAAIVRKSRLDVSRARSIVEEFLRRLEIDVMPVAANAAAAALDAFDRYGKGRGHPAQLNLCDCFAYAMAKQHGVALLYKGDDFAQTDLA